MSLNLCLVLPNQRKKERMGEFTQSLLKLTEFPFSYSLIGLLALIFGQGTNLEELSFAKIGPLLILMGFVATTLSICDPVGAIQRLIIKGRAWHWESLIITGPGLHWPKFRKEFWQLYDPNDVIDARIFGTTILHHFPAPYLFAIVYSPEDIMKYYITIDWDSIALLRGEELYTMVFRNKVADELKKIDKEHLTEIAELLGGLKDQTIKTKWITEEIDRITALVYFMVIISLFIVATQLYPVFLQNFAQFFNENIESTKLVILIFSILALIAVSIMFILRILGLLTKASIVFKYLTALGAIKTDKENFKTTLQDIERYLNDNNWTLAEYWVDRIQREYTELFLKKVKEVQKAEK
jgi:hypothetical protein